MSFLNPTTKTQSSMTGNQSQQTQQNMFGGQQGYSQPIEPSYMTGFRQSLMPQYQQLFQQSQQPLYGDPQVASFTNQLNSLGNSSINSLKAQLARSGALDSGRLSAGATDIQLGNLGQQAGFLSQIPFLNKQFSQQAGGQLLGQGMNFAGRAPVGQFNIGQQQADSSGSMTGQTSQEGTQTQTGSFLSSLFGNILGGLGSALTGGLSNLIGGQPWSGK